MKLHLNFYQGFVFPSELWIMKDVTPSGMFILVWILHLIGFVFELLLHYVKDYQRCFVLIGVVLTNMSIVVIWILNSFDI